MMHLLPIQWFVRVLITLVAFAVSGVAYIGWIGGENAAKDIGLLFRWSSTAAIVIFPLLLALWRWVPAIQILIFPYLGGMWEGKIRFDKDGVSDSRDITLDVKHTLFGIKMLMNSEESVSNTLVVHADRSPDFEIFKLFYIFLNERKPGFAGGGVRYLGLANIRVDWSNSPKLNGDYFTETHRKGTLHLTRTKRHPWWKLWR